ncbi:MAG: DNA-directed RNA polymerase subunit omega [Omnitrophica bacterium RIFCSPLOWO2_12_FULL_44_17]|uniref:DNA-directed RNA polymerase subunit omega n=1 Tax=Candidatus Danuiimicrobium aquiferis TaxID=1801832 RepID=A0A1G1KRQ3_9BACT|nr:MAG: DNA-directed RNA polymerase subunit omega [Omnitrophica bacterium RIFCSPHIGHO2_02_FULL_45_28]OGW91886.1 MAG: DNA-directed RNA polymerase subunit omega [Omnitrophica bacterium RIFCSPHIGHO2_12_FULL_44_12]OGW95588.1 MAG: DNA-directed RNA polymerase subunit omega [Omnitrophica bacterium RIFCSPLOWO2_12_FULL_44_17]OGX03697.1 MAG: DNA-directed RNA polymerase subunit omega [Omnitrophica bacterium RIFCSPLOWO2_02_FULL_44_11]
MNIPIEGLRKTESNRFRLVLVAARRANDLTSGAVSVMDVPGKFKPATIALQEIAIQKIRVEVPKEKSKSKK